MRFRLPQYTGKDYLVLAIIVVPYTILMNSVILGRHYYSSATVFFTSSLVTSVIHIIYFTGCGAVALMMKKRFSGDHQVWVRLSVMIFTFLLISGFYLLFLFWILNRLDLMQNVNIENAFIWAYIGQAILNIFITFLMEGIARYENWKANIAESGMLRQSYHQSQLQGLKSQVNPHFLFNSLNSLSSLITEDEDQAEQFLNEMSKVYRYMLRNEEDPLVTVETELKFLKSYLYLLNARYGNSIQLEIAVQDAASEKFLAPLSLQVIVENAYTLNAFSKKNPLLIQIISDNDDVIIVRNNIQPKMLTEAMDFESGLDNLVTKYRLMNQPPIVIKEYEKERIIRIPLIAEKEEVVL
jgi:two-component system LytT family sensor kinase